MSPQQPTSIEATEKVMRITGGLPPTHVYRRVSESFLAEWDEQRRTPRYVAEHLTADSLKNGGASRADMPFREDPTIPPHLRARLTDYKGSGWDRGHMAAAANHRSSEHAMADTFYMTNIAPQSPSVNRDYWARLEKFTRDLTKACTDVHVITGPLYLPTWVPTATPGKGKSKPSADAATAPAPEGHWEHRHPAIGEALRWVSVPTHFYKAVYATGLGADPSSPALVGAFVVPNEPVPPGTPLTDFLVPLSALEHAGGLSLFRGVSERDRGVVDAEALRIAGGGESLQEGVRKMRRTLFGGHPHAAGHGGGKNSSSSSGMYTGPLPPAVVPAIEVSASDGSETGTTGSGNGRSGRGAGKLDTSAGGLASAAAGALLLHAVGQQPTAWHLCRALPCELPSENWFAPSSGNAHHAEDGSPAAASAKGNGGEGKRSKAAKAAPPAAAAQASSNAGAVNATVGFDAAVSAAMVAPTPSAQ